MSGKLVKNPVPSATKSPERVKVSLALTTLLISNTNRLLGGGGGEIPAGKLSRIKSEPFEKTVKFEKLIAPPTVVVTMPPSSSSPLSNVKSLSSENSKVELSIGKPIENPPAGVTVPDPGTRPTPGSTVSAVKLKTPSVTRKLAASADSGNVAATEAVKAAVANLK
ncbi:MAG: hypothetical protein AAGA83_05910 [Cyanobacteria bacterium P01_F01_bin.116]